MTESMYSTGKASLNALSDLRSFFSGRYGNEEENEVKSYEKRSDLTRKALADVMNKYGNYDAETNNRDAYKNIQNNETQTNPLKVDTSSLPEQSPLEINRPEISTETNPLQIHIPSGEGQHALEIRVQETKTDEETGSYSIPKTKNSILYELSSSYAGTRLTPIEIAQKYGISYIQAQEIFVDLHQDANGIVKEFKLPENSTVSYLV